jgi:hypothetical protein
MRARAAAVQAVLTPASAQAVIIARVPMRLRHATGETFVHQAELGKAAQCRERAHLAATRYAGRTTTEHLPQVRLQRSAGPALRRQTPGSRTLAVPMRLRIRPDADRKAWWTSP